MLAALFSLSVDQLKNVSLAGVVAPIVVGAILMKFVAKAMVRTIIMVVALAVAGGVYSQRQEISDCYDDARSGDSIIGAEITCSFFGQDVTLTP